ncbi:MAG: hypothetical protein L0154_16515 [Chloroflexi bacterium]|nr:hypothetical protein [Chloroflexota bacterium]
MLDDKRTPGFLAHTTLAVSEAGVLLGLVQQQVWSRQQNQQLDKTAHKGQPIAAKESYKWLTGVTDLPPTDQQIVTVCDREADVYELFQYAHNQHLDFIVRSARNRRREDAPLLRDHLGELSPVATYSLSVQRQINQAEREAQVELRYSTVTLVPHNANARRRPCP